MKKLNKLQINSEKLMKNEELVIIRGGYGQEGTWMKCSCSNGANPPYADPWEKCYINVQDELNDVSTRCINGSGSCENLNLWCLS